MPTFTEKAIKISFMKLLNEKPLNKITVKEIVEDCGINRNSFYYHFSDIPSLLEEVLMDSVAEILESKSNPESIYDCLVEAIDFALKNKTAMMHIFNSQNRELFDRYLNRVSYHAVERYIAMMSQGYNLSEADKDVVVMYYKCQLVGFVIDWMSNGMKYDLRVKIRRICELYDGSMETAFARATQQTKADNL
jgi:AcrR family transcriptional regulator